MLGIEEALAKVMKIPGARSVTLVDYTSGLAVASAGSEELFDRDDDAASTTDIVRAVLASPVITTHGSGDDVHDIIVSEGGGYHLLCLLTNLFDGQLFLHLRLARDEGNLALARHNVQGLLREMVTS